MPAMNPKSKADLRTTPALPHQEEPSLAEASVKETPSWLGSFNAYEKATVAACVRGLSKPSGLQSFLAIVCNYAVILAMVWVWARFGTVGLCLIAIPVVGSRQHALLVLMHDAAHFRLFPSRRWNDWLANGFCTWPFFATIETYRRSHLAHHNRLNTDGDPDWMLKRGREEWSFPKTKPGLAKLFAGQLLGLGTIDQVKRLGRLNTRKKGEGNKAGPHFLARVIYYLALAGILTIGKLWSLYLLLWVIPFVTYLPFVLRVRGIAEHFGLSWETAFSSSRHVNPGWLERFFLAPHHVWCHTAHHLFPSVPFFNVGRLHQALMKSPSYAGQLHQNDGYFLGERSVVRDLLNSPSQSPKKNSINT